MVKSSRLTSPLGRRASSSCRWVAGSGGRSVTPGTINAEPRVGARGLAGLAGLGRVGRGRRAAVRWGDESDGGEQGRDPALLRDGGDEGGRGARARRWRCAPP